MTRLKRLVAAISVAGILCGAGTAARAAECDGFFIQDEQGYTRAPVGTALLAYGPVVPKGSTLAFGAVGRIGGRFVLYQARSPLVFDAQNISLTTGCRLPTR